MQWPHRPQRRRATRERRPTADRTRTSGVSAGCLLRIGWAVLMTASSVLLWIADNCTGGPRFDAVLDAAAAAVRTLQGSPAPETDRQPGEL